VALATVEPWSDERRRESLEATLAARADPGPVRVFAYGSLIWRPEFTPVAEAPARLPGWYRHTCLWSVTARGTKERPGLMFGLDADPARVCLGVAQTIGAETERSALEALWKREMHGGVYRPRWLEAEIETAGTWTRGWVLSFVVHHGAEQYAGDVPVEIAARYIATASGRRGACAEYYANTAASLRTRGIVDPEIEALVAAVGRVKSID
jgi:cation transport protein ChaC